LPEKSVPFFGAVLPVLLQSFAKNNSAVPQSLPAAPMGKTCGEMNKWYL
jgi:hypothetical protein